MIKKNIIIVFLFSGIICYSQDIHFSQFYNAPMKLNPANAGTFEGDLRVVSNYRNQWASANSPFKTFGFSADLQLLKNKWPNNYLGLALGFFNDKAGDLNLGSSQIDLTVSSILELSPVLTMTVGIQAAYMQYSLDYSLAQTGIQYNGGMYDPSLPTGEPDMFDPFSFFDVSSGVTWNYASGESNLAANDKFILNFGFAYFHLNRANLEFSSTDRLFSKIVAHGHSNIGLRYSKLALMPSYLFMLQGPQKELSLGSLVRLYLRKESRYTGTLSEISVLFGGHYRFGDAVIPSLGLEIGEYLIQFSYDLNISQLARSTHARGGFEFTLRYRNPELFSIGASSAINPKFM